MPHERPRHLEGILKKTARHSPLVGLFGHRQVGKTWLADRVASRYETLDRPGVIDSALNNPEGFLLQRVGAGLSVIDEAQLAPPLFSALKEWVRNHPRPGQFLLTGSVRFSSRRQIRESLTGRIISWELLPMDLSEAHGLPLPDAIPRLLKSSRAFESISLAPGRKFGRADMEKAMTHGGLPGVFAVRDPLVRAQRFESMLQTLLERDLSLILQTTVSISQLRSLLQLLALNQGAPLEFADLSRKSRISVPTLKKLLSAFEALFLVRLLDTEGTEKKRVLFFEDQGEANFLSGGRLDEASRWIGFLYSQLRAQVHYRPELMVRLFQFRNRGGTFLPLCFSNAQMTLGILPLLGQVPVSHALKTARAFRQAIAKQGRGEVAVLLVEPEGRTDQMIEPGIRQLPLFSLF